MSLVKADVIVELDVADLLNLHHIVYLREGQLKTRLLDAYESGESPDSNGSKFCQSELKDVMRLNLKLEKILNELGKVSLYQLNNKGLRDVR
jgi:hypothetical protein